MRAGSSPSDLWLEMPSLTCFSRWTYLKPTYQILPVHAGLYRTLEGW